MGALVLIAFIVVITGQILNIIKREKERKVRLEAAKHGGISMMEYAKTKRSTICWKAVELPDGTIAYIMCDEYGVITKANITTIPVSGCNDPKNKKPEYKARDGRVGVV